MLRPSPSNPQDLGLFAQAQRRDLAAFEALFRRYHQPLSHFVLGYVKAPAVAEAIVQDVFTALWTDGSRWRIRTTLRAWLFAEARGRAIRSLRREKRVLDLGDDGPSPAGDDTGSSRANFDPESPTDVARVRAALSTLPVRPRTAVSLRWGEQMSHTEIAEALGVSLKDVEKLLASGFAGLRTTLASG